MSTSHTTIVRCDAKKRDQRPCGRWIETSGNSVNDARIEAAAHGWAYSDGEDFCSLHVPAPAVDR